MKVFILTRAINEYDQDGEYFVNVFANKPSPEQLMANGVNQVVINHTLGGGGRTSALENEWFYLREYET